MSEDTKTIETTPFTDKDPADNLDATVQNSAEQLEMTEPPTSTPEEGDSTEWQAVNASGSEEGVRATENEADVEDALSHLATEVESLRLQLEERTSQCVRMAADFDNFRKRTEREKSDLELRVKRDAISELLPVIDSFERARTQINPQTEQEVNIHKSYQGVYKQLVDCLKRVGVSPMRVEGQPFDPNYHDAIMREATHEHPEGTVIEELRRGYLLGETVLRHAMVKVAAQPDSSETPESNEVGSSAEEV